MTIKKAVLSTGNVIKNNTFISAGPTPEAVRAAAVIANACLETAVALRHASEMLNVRAPGIMIGR